MENTEVEQPWEQQEDEELEEGLIVKRKNPNPTLLSTTFTNGDFSSNNGGSVISNGEEQEQEQEQEEEEVKDFSQRNGIKVDEDEKEKEKQQISEYFVYYDTEKGTGLHHESSAVEANGVDSTAHGKSPVLENINITRHDQDNGNGLYSVISNQNGEHQKHDNFSDSSLQPSEISFEELDDRSPSYINNKTESTDIEAIKDGDGEITEFDVETVLKKQDTHDLYCPNCNSCITKRVILRKRKRRIPAPGEDAKRNKPETPIPSEVNVVSDDSSNNQAQNGVDHSLDDVHPHASNEYDHQREPDLFRCLSCFSIFMPTGNGFKLFRMFGKRSDEQNNQPPQNEVPVKKHWFSSIFASDKMEKLNDQGSVQSLDGENNVAGVSVLSSNLDELNVLASSRQEANSHTTNGTTDLEDKPAADYVPSSSLHEPKGYILDNNQVQSAAPSVGRYDNAPSSMKGSDVIEQRIADESDNAIRKSNGWIATDSPVADSQNQMLTSYHIEPNGKSDYPGVFVIKPPFNNVEPAENSISPLQHDGLKILVPPNVGSLIIDNSQMNQELDVTVQTNSPGSDEKGRTNLSFSQSAPILGQSNLGGQMNDLEIPTYLAINGKEHNMDKYRDTVPEVSQQCTVQNNIEINLEEPLKVDKNVLRDKQINLREDSKNIERIKGKDTIITIEGKQLDASALQRSPDTLGVTGTPALQHVESASHAVEQGGATTATGGRSLDVVKSIVYGGLIESLASLSVVSSAAGADAATLNVLALGSANIFGGLFMISHDLWDLKNQCTIGYSDEASEQEDRYQQLLGRRANFPLHIVVSLLSYLVFGFLPPVVYGFSFRESNNRDLKLLMVAAASIVCIMTLAAGKVYVQRPHKSYFKTIAYYVVFGFMVSGVSYLFGDLLMKFLEKIDIFHSGSVANLSIHGASTKPALATY